MTESYRRGRRIGAHRRPLRRMPVWLKWLIALVAVLALTGVGLLLVQSMRADFLPTEPTSTEPVVAVDPITDPAEAPAGTSIAVLDATQEGGRAQAVADQIEDFGWIPGVSGEATAPYEQTIVFFEDPEYEGVARGIAEQLGIPTVSGTSVDLSDSPVTIVLGEDAAELGL